jgi:hypothetical protein
MRLIFDCFLDCLEAPQSLGDIELFVDKGERRIPAANTLNGGFKMEKASFLDM